MRIVILANSTSGLYQFRRELLMELVKTKDVVCSVPEIDKYSKKIESIGCKIVKTKMNRRGVNPIGDVYLLLQYIYLFKKYKPDLVFSYTIKCNIYGGIAGQIFKIPYIANITGLGTSIENDGILRLISLSMYKVGLRRARCVFFQNESNLKLFKSKRVLNCQAKIIPGSGVNLSTYKYETYPLDGRIFKFLFIGRIMKDKGIEELLHAVEKLIDDGEKVFLDIVGRCDDSYYSLLKENEKKGYVKYHGEQESVREFYSATQCVVLPSYHEGMANVLLEAAATGRPVIATCVPGCEETFDEGVTGLGCKARDVKSLKNAMKKMCLMTRCERERMGKLGRERMERIFDRNIVVRAYMDEI